MVPSLAVSVLNFLWSLTALPPYPNSRIALVTRGWPVRVSPPPESVFVLTNHSQSGIILGLLAGMYKRKDLVGSREKGEGVFLFFFS